MSCVISIEITMIHMRFFPISPPKIIFRTVRNFIQLFFRIFFDLREWKTFELKLLKILDHQINFFYVITKLPKKKLKIVIWAVGKTAEELADHITKWITDKLMKKWRNFLNFVKWYFRNKFKNYLEQIPGGMFSEAFKKKTPV